MKSKSIVFLIISMLLTGCAGKGNDEPKLEQMEGTESSQGSTDSAPEQDNIRNDSTDNAATDNQVYILEFEATTMEGETMTSDVFADSKLTMLNVWATYCNPCLSEMQYLGELSQEYDKAEFQIIGIISDVAENGDEYSIELAKDLIEETGANYPHLPLNQSLYTNLVGAVTAVPTTFFVNANGELLGYISGAYPKESWEEIINGLLSEME
ncbi:MAG: TlpA family protein disulfide reductase [Lachnospiraceae bacterium]|nr:TlpA family protein disulfide reductase [Lachnospiraceae bacterium]